MMRTKKRCSRLYRCQTNAVVAPTVVQMHLSMEAAGVPFVPHLLYLLTMDTGPNIHVDPAEKGFHRSDDREFHDKVGLLQAAQRPSTLDWLVSPSAPHLFCCAVMGAPSSSVSPR